MCSTANLGWWRGLGVLAVALLCPVPARAAPLITLGTYNLLPNTPGQTINIYVGGGDTSIDSTDVNVTTGDGGPTYAAAELGYTGNVVTNHILAPAITNVNLLATNALFSPYPTNVSVAQSGTVGQYPTPQFYVVSDFLGSGSVSLSGTFTDPVSGRTGQALLAVVTIDTTGFSSGSYSISVDGTVSNGGVVVTGNTDFPPDTNSGTTAFAGFTDGVINIVPEPATLGLLGLVIPGLLLRRRRA